MLARSASHLKTQLGKHCLPSSLTYLLEGFSPLVTAGQKLPSVLCTMDLSKMWSLVSSKRKSSRKRKSHSYTTESRKWHHLYHILLDRSKAQVYTSLKWEAYTRAQISGADHWGLSYSWATTIGRTEAELQPIYPNSHPYDKHCLSIPPSPQPFTYMHFEHTCSITYDQGNVRI